MAKTLTWTFILLIFAATTLSTTSSTADTDSSATASAATDGLATASAATDGSSAAPATPGLSSAAPATPGPSSAAPATPGPSSAAPATPGPSSAAPATPGPSSAAPATPGPSSAAPATTGQTGGTGGPTVSPGTGTAPTKDPNASSTGPVATTALPKPCDSAPCLDGSTCENLAGQGYRCLCLGGDFYYDGRGCSKAKVFLGFLKLTKVFTAAMSDKASQEFNTTSDEIINAIKGPLNKTGYLGSSVVELRESVTRSSSGNVEATVENSYAVTAAVTDKDVEEAMQGAIGEEITGFTAKSLCESKTCDEMSTVCQSANGEFSCTCKSGYFSTPLSDRSCVACLPGQKYDGTSCVPCPTGYSGVNCKDNTMLILIIICPILGVLMIAALIALPIVTTTLKKKSTKSKDDDIGKPYLSHSVAKAPLSNSYSPSVKEPNNLASNTGAPKFPRATANSSWDSRTNLEMTPSNSRQNLIPSGRNSRLNDSKDDMFSFPRPQSNLYAQVQPKSNPYEHIQSRSNPYAQNRTSNPYAQSRGQTNPYFN